MFPIRSNSPIKVIPNQYCPKGSDNWFVIPDGPDQGKNLFYYDFVIGKGAVEKTVVFVHGNPESSYTYAQTRDHLIALAKKNNQTIRIIAMDHIGFGLSDQASFEMVDMHHANNLRYLVRELDLQNVTLVIHDWGGAIGTAGFKFDTHRVTGLVLMNTTIFPMPKSGVTYKSFPFRWLAWNHLGFYVPATLWRFIPPMVMFSPAGKWNVLKHFAKFIQRACLGRLTQEEIFYRDMFSTKMNALSSKRNVKQTRVWGHGYDYQAKGLGRQSNKEFYQKLQELIPVNWGDHGFQKGIPVKAYFGEFDPLARQEVIDQWLAALPQLKGNLKKYPNVGHFVEEHKYQDIAEGIYDVTFNGEQILKRQA